VRKRQIAELTEVESMHRHNIDYLQNDIDHLFNERSQLQQFVCRFKNNNDKYLKIKDVAEEQVNRLLTEQETLSDLALNAVIEALRMNPDRYKIYNRKYDNNDNYITTKLTLTTWSRQLKNTVLKALKMSFVQARVYRKSVENMITISATISVPNTLMKSGL
jgi:chorismate mutase